MTTLTRRVTRDALIHATFMAVVFVITVLVTIPCWLITRPDVWTDQAVNAGVHKRGEG